MSYGFCYAIVFVSVAVSYTDAYSSTLFSPPTQYAAKHTVARATVIVVLFRNLSSLYFFHFKLILYSTQSLSLRKIITNTHNNDQEQDGCREYQK